MSELKPCPFCNEAERRGFINGQISMLEHAVRQAELSTRPIIIEDTRPTPSSALTKALEVLKERQSHYHIVKDSGEDVSECLRCMAESALRASPGGEGEIERHGDCSARIERAQKLQMEIDAGYWKKEVEQAEIRGAEWAVEAADEGRHVLYSKEEVKKIAAAIVASHRAPAPEKEGRQ